MRQFPYLLIFSFLLLFSSAESQISRGGLPQSYSNKQLQENFQSVEVFADKKLISDTDNKRDGFIGPHKIGFTIPTDYSPNNSGTWYTLANGDRVWKIEIRSSGAEALAIYFKDFELPENAELFLYNKNKTQEIGAFTRENNPKSGFFGTEIIGGDLVIIEYYVPFKYEDNYPFTISEVAYVYRDSGFGTYKGFNGSGNCEVNINCVEGQNWQQQKKGVARIQVKDGSGLFWCSGSLINNTRNDFTPYFLTANHCGLTSSSADYEQWVFHFNYESIDCDNPVNEPISNTMTGGSLIANANNGTANFSDFKLILLNENVPESYDPYFNGWSKSLIASTEGASIHHPSGDIKKISLYNTPLISTNYDALTDNANGLYWRVLWAETANGYGVTEGGSSGSPMFNSDGRIIGTLTGGGATCSDLTEPDYYGKFSYSWESNGVENNKKLRPWLDPLDAGFENQNGISYNEVLFIPEFGVDTVAVPIGGSIIFNDLSIGNPTQWEWSFEGGIPASSTLQVPQAITYQSLGQYNVSLQIRNGLKNEVILKENYIKVVPKIGPLPSDDKVTIYLGTSPVGNLVFTLYDESGREMERHIQTSAVKFVDFYLGKYSAGYYFLKVETSNTVTLHKVAIY